MPVPESPRTSEPNCAFGVPEHHFLLLVMQALDGLLQQSRERGYTQLTSALLTAKREAQEALSVNAPASRHPPDDARLMTLVEGIRNEINDATQANRWAPDEKPRAGHS